MKRLLVLLFLIPNWILAQQGLVPTSSYYRDRLFDNQIESSESNKLHGNYMGSGFLPELESFYNLHDRIRDRSNQYSEFTEKLFKKHMFEVNAQDAKVFISPVGEFSYGKELNDTTGNYLYKNSRGIQIQADLFKNFSFQTSFYENQARFSSFERDFIDANGEYYTTSIGYNQQNGVVPGAARTKPFKTNGYDYAFAVGHFVYSPFKNFSVVAGNNQQFVGSGYRSLLYGNHHIGTPYFRTKFTFLKKWEWNFFRTRSMNLVRKKTYTTVEGYYQPKIVGINYVTWRPLQKFSVHFSENTVWKMGDSLVTKAAHPLVLSPVPFSARITTNDAVYSFYALSLDWSVLNSLRTYGQFVTPFTRSFAGQIGIRYNPKIPIRTLLQLEYNVVSKNMYQGVNELTNYSNYNLPIAHIMGNGFQEILFRISSELNRFYFGLNAHLFFLKDYTRHSLQAIQLQNSTTNGLLNNTKLEIGYRLNQKLNINIYAQCVQRKEWWEQGKNTLLFQVGIRTGLIDNVNDF